MVFWMKRQSAGISLDLRHQIDGALSRGSVFALTLLAFSAVAREGFETTLFLFAGSTNASGTEFVLGGAIGFAIAGACGVVLYYGAAKLPAQTILPRPELPSSSSPRGLLSNALSELQEAALITDLGSRPWDFESTLSMTSTLGKFLHTVLGYDAAPAMAQIILYWGYTTIVLGAYLFLPSGKSPQIRPVAEASLPSEPARELIART
jgi:high-affinity iron transporter